MPLAQQLDQMRYRYLHSNTFKKSDLHPSYFNAYFQNLLFLMCGVDRITKHNAIVMWGDQNLKPDQKLTFSRYMPIWHQHQQFAKLMTGILANNSEVHDPFLKVCKKH